MRGCPASMLPFHVLFPEQAKNEVRTVTPFGDAVLPGRTFLFIEAYCIEPNCDCRRVLVNVVDAERREQVATISHAFEPPAPPHEHEGQTFLDPLNPQSDLSDAPLELFAGMVAADAEYAARLERHYAMWKRIVNDPSHPAQALLRRSRTGYGILGDPRPVRRGGPEVGPNDPCPCGSGRKHKRCCGHRPGAGRR